MNPFASILVPLDGSVTATGSLRCAIWLGSQLKSRWHILSVTGPGLPARAELARLQVASEYWPLVELHQAPTLTEEAILAAVALHHVGLVVMTAHGQAADGGVVSPDAFNPIEPIGPVARTVVEHSPVPVLLLPPAYREQLPWRRVLVPVSGEPAADAALALTAQLAKALRLEVHVAHVEDAGPEGVAATARYADAVHHEYPGRLGELVSRALPRSAAEDISEVALCRGDVAAELLRLIDAEQISLLVIGWSGQLIAGHARVLKQLLQVVTCPVLLVKPAPRMPFKLKVGDELDQGG